MILNLSVKRAMGQLLRGRDRQDFQLLGGRHRDDAREENGVLHALERGESHNHVRSRLHRLVLQEGGQGSLATEEWGR